ncbi:hypothetical protein [Bacillus sp. JJ722]|uniref:hypothetical protein n=1 Tax=Bacillus sp. JJ722 TaxID=3122973 RepID=UPI002FFD80B2
MYYSHYSPYGIIPILQNNGLIYNNNQMRNDLGYYEVNPEDQRFFPFLLPFAFVAGLAIGPLLFNRPYPYPIYTPYPVPQAYPIPQPYPVPYPTTMFNQSQQAFNPVYGGITENVNIYAK